MLETLPNMHVVANIPVNHHMLCHLCIPRHFSLEINFIKVDLNTSFI